MAERLEVQSELYEEAEFTQSNTLTNKNTLLFLQFQRASLSESSGNVCEDSDGDLLVPRRKYSILEVECSPSTPLGLVGLQLWRGAFLLADYILANPCIFTGSVVLELGTGIGFTSIVAGMLAKEVISTDLEVGGIFDLIRRNINRNKNYTKAYHSVLPLDFYSNKLSSELSKKIQDVNIILAADVIYDNELTDAFINTLINLLDTPGKKTFYLALEKRYVFTLADLDTVAPCYEHFMTELTKKSRRPPMSSWRIRHVSIDFKQSFKYERSKHLVMLEITT